MVVDEVCHTPTTTTSVIVLSMSKTFFSCHLFNKDGKGPMELFKGEKLDQTLLMFAPLRSLGICNLIASPNHHLGNSNSIDCILKLKALFGYYYI